MRAVKFLLALLRCFARWGTGDSANELRQLFEMREIWRQLVLNEDRAMTERSTLFLIVNSIMVGGYAIATSCWLRLLLAVAGLIFALVWFYLAERGRKNLNFFWAMGLATEKRLPEEQRVFKPSAAAREKYGFWKFEARKILSWVLPLGWVAVWSVILVMSLATAC